MAKFQFIFGLALLLSLGLIRNVNGDCTNSDGSTCSGTECCYDGTNGLSPVLGSGGGITPIQDCYPTGAGNGVTYTCPGDLRGPPFNDCIDGTWQFGFAPTCEGVTSCPRPTVPTDVSITPDTPTYDLNTQITYACDDGYTLGGPSEAACESGGVWNPSTVPTCEPNCAKPTLTNGGVSPDQESFSNGDVLIYVCNTNYTLVGLPATKCRSGVYDPSSKPTCFSVTSCPQPTVPTDGSITPDTPTYDFYTRITYACDDGYTVVGPSEAVCERGGVWNPDTLPTCEADCAKPTLVNGGVNPDQESFSSGEVLTYQCNTDYTLVGVSTAVCRNGVYDPPTKPTCLS